MTSKAFKKGFVDGFTAPFTFLNKKSIRPDQYQASVEKAWKDVGDAFHDVMTKEGVTGGQGSDKKRRQSKQAA